jgi:hypothetical protein
MVIEEARGTREEEGRMWFGAVTRWSSSSVDESEVVDESEAGSGDVDGDDGAWRVSARVRRGVDSVSRVVGLPESSKRRLELRVRSGVRVEGCRDRMVRQVRRTLSVSKKKWKAARLGSQH